MSDNDTGGLLELMIDEAINRIINVMQYHLYTTREREKVTKCFA